MSSHEVTQGVSTQLAGGPRIYLETFGCQMNELDSELVRGALAALGYRFTTVPREADVILYNTCSVREQAENKALSRVGRVGVAKGEGRSVVLGLIGCLAEREGAGLLRKYPQIDFLCGPGELDKVPMLLDNVMKARVSEIADRVALQGSTSRRSTTLAAATDDLELLDLSRAFDPAGAAAGGRAAYVRITRGCNKFCTYCVVPNTRGPEVHRPPDAIVEECRRLADHGVIEITLLGQTVNHYRYVHGRAVGVDGREAPQVGPGSAAFKNGGHKAAGRTGERVTTFADLLRRIHEEVPEVARLRFVTSFPRDFGDDILDVMAASPRICRYLHAPAQSGSDRILRLMNRGYTRAEYLEFVERARERLPDVSIAGDVIVGFPTESDEDFEETKSLLRTVRFKNNFIFKYSPRPGTAAWDRLADDVPEVVKRRRNNELLALQAEFSLESHRALIGRTVEVFVEQESEHSARDRTESAGKGRVELRWETQEAAGERTGGERRVQMSGRTGGDHITVFDLPSGGSAHELLGRLVRVRVTGAGALILRGELETPAEAGGQGLSQLKNVGKSETCILTHPAAKVF